MIWPEVLVRIFCACREQEQPDIDMRIAPMLKLLLAGAVIAAATQAFANPTLVFDLDSGRIYSHQNAFKRWYPASVTKLMTAYVTYRAIANGELTLESPIRISKKATGQPPSKIGFKAGSVASLDNVLKMMLVKSGNDMAMAVAENVGGSETKFVERMNAEAARLGMTGTHFANPHGLFSPQQYTTARDLAILASALRKEFPQYDGYFTIEALQLGKTRMDNFNLLAGRYEGNNGMKTGFVCESGYNMVGSATRNGRTVVAINFGEPSVGARADAMAALLDGGFASAGPGTDTISTLAPYGEALDQPGNLRAAICPKPAPGQTAEEVGETSVTTARSKYELPFSPPPKLVTVGLGGATGPVPLARRGEGGAEMADVPIPRWRPDIPPPSFDNPPQGDGVAGELRK